MSHTIDSLVKQNGVYLDNITVNGVNHLIDFYLNFSEKDDKYYTYQDIDEKNIAVLDPDKELIPKLLNKGVFETIDEVTQEKVSIQFYKTLPLEITE